MRVLVVTSGALFVRGGHLVIAEELAAALRRSGHEAEVLVTPQNRFGRQASAYLATWLTDVGQTADGRPVDRVVSFRFPSYAVRHPRHICWLNHRMREYYDLWETFAGGLGRRGRLKETLRRALVHGVDRWLLTRNVTRLVAQSRTIQARLRRFGDIPSEVLHPPAPARPYRTEGYGDYIFAVSRLDRLKRLDLLIDAAARLGDGARVAIKIAGDGPERPRLLERLRAARLEGVVELLGPISDEEVLTHLARCRAVYYAPRDEDYGLVTLQAFHAAKAVITATDSGGPTEIVEDGKSGFVVAPTAEAVAASLVRLRDDVGLAERLGLTAAQVGRRHTWEQAVDVLLEEGGSDRSAAHLPASH